MTRIAAGGARERPERTGAGASPVPRGAGRCRVAVVDDDRFFLHVIADALESAGFSARCYPTPEDALAGLEVEPPTVVVSDYWMPGMDGVAFLELARIAVPDAVRILCTTAQDFDVAASAVNASEVYRIVSKPALPQELVAVVRQASEAAQRRLDDETEVQRDLQQLREVNGRLEGMVRERTQALLDGLIAALDYRDNDTQWHSRRVSSLARRLAEQLGIREPELSVIEHGALLHDIGKIGVRDCVLLKPGPLSQEEWDEMKRHAEMGWALLRRVDCLRPSSTIVLQHQERWDGAGYPQAIRGEQIVIGARIFHVVDALDAITSDRPYRRARPLRDACAEIARCRGTQFDPSVVDAFLSVKEEEWERIRLAFPAAAHPFSGLAGRAPARARHLQAELESSRRAESESLAGDPRRALRRDLRGSDLSVVLSPGSVPAAEGSIS